MDDEPRRYHLTNEPLSRARERALHDTDDAMVWAQEFCRVFEVIGMEGSVPKPMSKDNQIGLMVGWFANAMQTALELNR